MYMHYNGIRYRAFNSDGGLGEAVTMRLGSFIANIHDHATEHLY